jgi:hypothetical protein
MYFSVPVRFPDHHGRPVLSSLTPLMVVRATVTPWGHWYVFRIAAVSALQHPPFAVFLTNPADNLMIRDNP